jgi:hypothetical protein
MTTQPLGQNWHILSMEILTGMQEWRHTHPRATLREMETEVDARWARLRAQLLSDLAQHSPAAAWAECPVAEHPRCPQCDVPLDPRGTHTRHLQTHGGRALALARSYGVCPSCQDGFFPLG